jgi:hypothetical protein
LSITRSFSTLTMMAPEYYIFTGRERVPRHVTHVLIAKALKFVPARAFYLHPNIQEVICHDGVLKVEHHAFNECRSLRRVIMPGVKEVEYSAFTFCSALTYIECGKLERIEAWAFNDCCSLSSIDLPSVKILEMRAYSGCTNLINVKFGKELESIGRGAFYDCTSLERIALPLKDDMITHDGIFLGCKKLKHVDLIGEVHETVAALLMEEWENDMNEEIESISQILATTSAGGLGGLGGKAQAIRAWIRTVLRKTDHYKAVHRSYLNEATTALKSSLPNDIVFKNILPFLELPS